MNLLRDKDIVANLTAKSATDRYIEGVELPADPYSKDSPVQGSSIDLHIGNIYLPGAKQSDVGGVENPKPDHVLETGETAVVTTQERLHFPATITGLGFPPSRVSFKGLLMTNPGHIDPGYEGVMRFTVINMARDPFPLERGEKIVTLLLFQLDEAVQASWRQRNPGQVGNDNPASPINQMNINRLSRDFVDVEKRSKRFARDQGIKWSLGISASVAILVAALQLFSSGGLFSRADISDLKKRQEMVEYDLKNRVTIEQKLQDFDNRLKDIERATTDKGK
jgi:dCTP deaminase